MKELKDAQTQNSPDLERKFLHDPINAITFSLLDIPAELAFIYSKLDGILILFSYQLIRQIIMIANKVFLLLRLG